MCVRLLALEVEFWERNNRWVGLRRKHPSHPKTLFTISHENDDSMIDTHRLRDIGVGE